MNGTKIRRQTIPAETRFRAKVSQAGHEDCWPWNAGTTKQGYGGFHPTKNEMVLAHRYAYELEHGPISPGEVVDHTCHNGQSCPPGPCEHRLCCNPAHLEPTSRPDNVNRSHNSNIQKTHCPHGHEYTPDNTIHQYKPNTTSRACLTCRRNYDSSPKRQAAQRARRAQLKEAS